MKIRADISFHLVSCLFLMAKAQNATILNRSSSGMKPIFSFVANKLFESVLSTLYDFSFQNQIEKVESKLWKRRNHFQFQFSFFTFSVATK